MYRNVRVDRNIVEIVKYGSQHVLKLFSEFFNLSHRQGHWLFYLSIQLFSRTNSVNILQCYFTQKIQLGYSHVRIRISLKV